MQRIRSSGLLALGLIVVMSALGCAGDMPPGTPVVDGGGAHDGVVRFDQTPLWLDQGWIQRDTQSPPLQDTGTPPAPDTGLPPDTGTTQPGVGEPCNDGNCPGLLECIAGFCRAQCNQPPTDPCGAISDCAANEACIPTSQTGVWMCMPATTIGSPCDQQTYCPNNTVCASVNNAAHLCLPLCTVVNQPCGTGGNCLNAGNGCLVCSKP